MNKPKKVICSGKLEKSILNRCSRTDCLHYKLHEINEICTQGTCPCSVEPVFCIVPTKKQKLTLMLEAL